jgi:hypothetical protein
MMRIFTAFIFLTLTLNGCRSTPPQIVHSKVQGSLTENLLKDKTVLITEPVFLKDINSEKDTKSDYRKNSFVGHIVYDGGLTRSQESYGTTVHSKEIILKEPEEIKKRASLWLNRAALSYVQSKGGRSVSGKLSKPLTVTGVEDYSDYDKTGQDNINNPVYQWSYSDSVNTTGPGHDYLVIPVIQYYYTHTAGWFYGQDIGSGTGARISIVFLIYRGSDGLKEGSVHYTAKRIFPATYDLKVGEYFELLSKLENEINMAIVPDKKN